MKAKELKEAAERGGKQAAIQPRGDIPLLHGRHAGGFAVEGKANPEKEVGRPS